MATYFQIVEPPLSTLLGVGLQIPLTIGVVDLEDEDATVVLLPGFTAELLDATDEVSAFIDEELGITGPFWADEEFPLAVVSAAELVPSSWASLELRISSPLPAAFSIAATHSGSSLQAAIASGMRFAMPSSLNSP
jgi:hypothetical protein